MDVIKNERPDLEAKKDALVVSIAADQKSLKDLENKILQMLASASGNILDDEELIETLGECGVELLGWKAIGRLLIFNFGAGDEGQELEMLFSDWRVERP